MKLLIINGPNLNLLGQREKGIYGERTFESYLEELRGRFPGVTIDCYQSNIEGEIVDRLHASQDVYDGVVINAGAYTHTSIAIAERSEASARRWSRCTSPVFWPGRSTATSR